MAQKRNTVQLTQTALNRLQKLVDTGEYCSLDDAASHVIVSTLPSTGQYSPVLTINQPKTTQTESLQTVATSNQNGTTQVKSASKPRPPIEGL